MLFQNFTLFSRRISAKRKTLGPYLLLEKLTVFQLVQKFLLSVLNVHYHVNDSPPRDSIPSQINPILVFTRHFFILLFSLIYQSHLGLASDICPSGSQTNTLYAILISLRGAPYSINHILLYFNTLKLFGEAPLGEVFSSLLSLPSSCPYPEPIESNPHFDILFHLDPF